jgi:hypothetical protein
MPYAQIRDGRSLSLCGVLILLLVMPTLKTFAQATVVCVRPDGRNGCYSTIGAAVAFAEQTNATEVMVYSGTYNEGVVLSGLISLVAADHAEVIIDASGQPNGIFVNGLSQAPNEFVGLGTVIRGFKVRNAQFEGILIANDSDVTLIDNEVTHNDLALDINAGACPGIPGFETSEQEDCGAGIHLIAVSGSSIAHNRVWDNAGGILITDETGPSLSNFIAENDVHDNPYDSGITMASYAPATSVVPSATTSYGVYNNVVAHNHSWSNGNKPPGSGAGIGIFATSPGTAAYANVVIDNDIRNNGAGGVAMHLTPSETLSLSASNQILGNFFAANGQDPGNPQSDGPTGISFSIPYTSLFSYGTPTTMVLANRFKDESKDVVISSLNPNGGFLLAHLNNFAPTFGIYEAFLDLDDSSNWWNCPSGPIETDVPGQPPAVVSGPCAGEEARHHTGSPWLTQPFPYPYDTDREHDWDDGH